MDEIRDACAAVRELMLEAEPAELRAKGSSPVAVHVRQCVQCRALAHRMLNAQHDLGVALDRLTEQSATEVPPDLTKQRASGARRSFRTRYAAGALAPLVAAAVLVLMLYPRSGDELPPLEPLPDDRAFADDRPVVNVASGDDVAIMSTTVPNITVVWYLKRER